MGSPGNNTECSPFDAKIYSTVAAVSAVSGFVSLLASSFIIFIIFLFKKWRFFSQRLVLYLAITAAAMSLSIILLRVDYKQQTGASYSNFCVFRGFFSQISSWMVLDAVTSITISLLMRTFFNTRPETFERLFLLFIFVFPFTFNWIPFIKLAYGKSGAWCWIRATDEVTCKHFLFGQILQLVLWYLPLYATILVLIIIYIMIIIKLYCSKKSALEQGGHEQVMKEVSSLLAYPLIYFVINIPPLINRIHGAVEPDNPQPALWFLSAIFFPLQGGITALALSLDPETRRRLTIANFRVAFSNIYHSRKTTINEYPILTEIDESDSLKQGLIIKDL